ncbi:choice-of-anchor I family protein [Glycomyces tenuis]|uniref:choice-of-anchor I family protein n=1 Tax=Glycomyces tenuis TaxID=58116 RepID=UPI00040EF995|nr:choice-of-anchor I family protein [Glycomyces tenuis]
MHQRLLAPVFAVAVAALALPSAASAQESDAETGGAVELSVLGSHDTGVFAAGASEIVAYDPQTRRVFAVNAEAAVVDVLDVADPAAPTELFELDAAAALGVDGATVNSVDVHGGLVAAAVEAPAKTDPGWVAFFDTDGGFIDSAQVGSLPDSLAFTPDGSRVVVANEGEPAEDYSTDPAGTVSVVDAATHEASTADFASWDAESLPEGFRVFGPDGGADIPANIEPEYVTVADDDTAYVTLQENNAIAVVDIAAAEVTEILPLGFKDHLAPGNELDASDEDGAAHLAAWPVYGMYLPDSIASYTAGGETHLVTANEGDTRDWDGYSEETRVEDLELCEGAERFAGHDLAELQSAEQLGRLKVTASLGQSAEGCYEELYSFGGRSFSIWNSSGELVFDSGSAIEELVAEAEPEHFNADSEDNDFDGRSDDKGPEPEAVAVGQVGDRTYAFIGLERQSGIVVYDITDPASAEFVDYATARDFTAVPGEGDAGDLGPESIAFIGAEDSPNGRPMLAVGNEVSGTTTLWDVTAGDAGAEPGDDASGAPVLPVTGTGATGLLIAVAAVLAVGGGLLLLAKRRTA